MLPADPDLALCAVSRHCTARARCYRSPVVRAQATGEDQVWFAPHVQPEGPCTEWWAVPGMVSGEARYLAPDQVDEHRAAGWTVEPALGHHGEAGYHVAVREEFQALAARQEPMGAKFNEAIFKGVEGLYET